jgi:hypothetical protein
MTVQNWNEFWKLPDSSVNMGWRYLPPLAEVKNFLVLHNPVFAANNKSAPITCTFTPAQIEMLKNNKTCVWIGEYCPEKKKFVLWNIFIYIYIDGRKVSRATYLPKKCSKVRYHGPALVNLTEAGIKFAGKTQFTLEIYKDVEQFTQLTKQEPSACRPGYIVMCMGYQLQPQEFVDKHIKALPIGLYRANKNDDDDDLTVTGGTTSLSFKDPLTFAKIEHPVRGAECDHLLCCDLLTLLTMSVEMKTSFDWQCQICGNLMAGIVYDPEVKAVIDKYKNKSEVDVDLMRWGSNGYLP